MTHEDVLVQILSEVTGKPKNEISDLMTVFKDRFPTGHKFNEELPDEKAEKLLNDLRKEKAGILKWLVEGKMMAEKKIGHA